VTYKLTPRADIVQCLTTGAFIPRTHPDWRGYEQFLAGGGVPQPLAAPRNLDEMKADLVTAATAQRWAHETGGVELGGVRVGTTLDDQNRISGVLSAIALGGLEAVDFKAASGWVRLTAAQLQGIAQAISGHVQACFSAERAHHEAIAAIGTLEQAGAYDVTQRWPE
jgi:hypothetical protein